MIQEQTNSTILPERLDYLGILRTFIKYRKLIAGCALAGTLTCGAVSLLIPNSYTAKSTLLPIEKSGTNLSTMLGAMGGLGVLAAEAGIGSSSAGDKFVTILQSRTITESVIVNQKLLPVLFKDRWDEARGTWKAPALPWEKASTPSLQDGVQRLNDWVKIGKDKKQEIVNIRAMAPSPELAAKLANAYTEELNRYLNKTAISTAKRNRLFIESQLNNAKAEMASFEVDLKNFQQKHNLVSLDAQAEASVKAYAEIRARLMAAEVELGLLEKSSIDGDPRLSLKQQEIEELKKQLSQVRDGASTDGMVSFTQAPSLGLNYLRIKRELLVREKVFELLTQQYEMAKIQEAQEDLSFQVLDTAIPPEKKSAPSRLTLVVTAFIASIFGGSLWALALSYWQSNKAKILLQLSTTESTTS